MFKIRFDTNSLFWFLMGILFCVVGYANRDKINFTPTLRLEKDTTADWVVVQEVKSSDGKYSAKSYVFGQLEKVCLENSKGVQACYVISGIYNIHWDGDYMKFETADRSCQIRTGSKSFSCMAKLTTPMPTATAITFP